MTTPWVPGHVTLRMIIAGVFMVATGISGTASSVAYYDMLDAVNAMRKPDSQIGHWEARYLGGEIARDYRAFYPDGPLLNRYRTRTIVSVAAFVVAVACFLAD